ncbi:MAG: hypothetical protein LBO02_01110 [Holosporaceae bacterium]|jgi:hypothetical protein|nr:hypothetical protein [Holosporaceae bacterium]
MTEILDAKCRNYTQNTHNWDRLKEKWPSPFVSRDRVSEFTNGMFKQRSLNTMDARGDGITPRYARGAKIFYEVDSVVLWLETKTKYEGER